MTASGREVNERTLGEFDIETLKRIRNLAESHVRKATEAALTASGDPGDYITDEFLSEFIQVATGAWDEGLGIVTAMFGELPNPICWSTIDTGIKNAVSYYDELLRALLSKNTSKRAPIYGEFLVGNTVQYGDVRPILSRLGGGSTDPVVEINGGITSGNTMREWLRSNGIDTDKKIWLYGYEDDPRRTFNGHLQMDGLVFDKWDDEGLVIAPQDAWLRRSHYAPGDHWGCACVVAPYIPNFGDEYLLELPNV